MGNLLFSFNGRIGPADFQKGALILIVIGAIIALLPLVSPALAMLGIIGLVMIWCWIAIWVKRYHDAGKSGWMIVVPIIVMIVLSIIASMVVNMVAPPDAEAMAAAMEGGDFGSMFQSMMAAQKGQILPSAVGNVVVQLIVVYLFNNMIKSDPEENRFGPATS